MSTNNVGKSKSLFNFESKEGIPPIPIIDLNIKKK